MDSNAVDSNLSGRYGYPICNNVGNIIANSTQTCAMYQTKLAGFTHCEI